MSGKFSLQVFLIALVVVCGFALRANIVGEDCLWFDEIFSVHAATQPWDNFFNFIALDLIHPPLFYIILKAWIAIGGESVTSLRALPVALWAISLIPFSMLARELKLNFKSFLFGFCFLIFSGSILKYSIELRMYSLMLCLSLFSTWLFLRYVNKRGYFLALLAINIALVYSHYFGWFVVAAEVLIAAFFYREKLKPTVGMAVGTALFFLPWITTIWTASAAGEGLKQNIGWMSRPGPVEVIKFILNLAEPFYFQTSTAEPVSILWITLPLVILVVAGGTIAIAGYEIEERRSLFTLTLLAAVPLFCAFTLSWISPFSIWGTRHLIIVFAPAYLLAGALIFGHRNVWLKHTFGLAFCVLFSVAALSSVVRDGPKASWCEVTSMTQGLGQAQTPILATEDLVAYQIWFAEQGSVPKRAVLKLAGIDGIKEDAAYFLPRGFDEVKIVDVKVLDEPKFWLIVRGKTVSETEPPIRNLIVKGYHVRDRRLSSAGAEQIGVFLMER